MKMDGKIDKQSAWLVGLATLTIGMGVVRSSADQFSGQMSTDEQGLVSFSWPTLAGYGYSVETSTDLDGWEEFGFYYGTGQTVSIPVAEIAVGNNQGGGSPPPANLPTRRSAFFSIRYFVGMTKALVSWRMQGQEGLSQVLLNEDFSGFVSWPLFMGNFEDAANNEEISLSFHINGGTFQSQFDSLVPGLLSVDELAYLALFTDRISEVRLAMLDALNGNQTSNGTPSSVTNTGSRVFFRCTEQIQDSDNDGIPDHFESVFGTDSWLRDSDGDGYSDEEEINSGHNPNDPNSNPNTEPNPEDPLYEAIGSDIPKPVGSGDEDADGLLDEFETQIGADSTTKDSDQDGLIDGRDSWPTDPILTTEAKSLPQYLTVELPALNQDEFIVDVNSKSQVVVHGGPEFSNVFMTAPRVWNPETKLFVTLPFGNLTQTIWIPDGVDQNGDPVFKTQTVNVIGYRAIGISNDSQIVARCLFQSPGGTASTRPPKSASSAPAGMTDPMTSSPISIGFWAVVVWDGLDATAPEILDPGTQGTEPTVYRNPYPELMNGEGMLVGDSGWEYTWTENSQSHTLMASVPTKWTASSRDSAGVPLYVPTHENQSDTLRFYWFNCLSHDGRLGGMVVPVGASAAGIDQSAIWENWGDGESPSHLLPLIENDAYEIAAVEEIGGKLTAVTSRLVVLDSGTWKVGALPSFGSLAAGHVLPNGAITTSSGGGGIIHYGGVIPFSDAIPGPGTFCTGVGSQSSNGILTMFGEKNSAPWNAVSIPLKVEFVKINEDGTLSDDVADMSNLSLPSPEIFVTGNPEIVAKFGANGELLADITFEGSVESKVADMMNGTEACPTSVSVYVNGESESSATMSLTTVESGGTGLYSYKKEMTFDKTLTDIPITEGLNTIELRALNPLFGLSGFRELTFEVKLFGADENGGHPSLPFYSLEIVAPEEFDPAVVDTVSFVISVDGLAFNSLTLTETGIDSKEFSIIGTEDVLLTFATSENGAPDGGPQTRGTVSSTSYGLDGMEVVMDIQSGSMSGSLAPVPIDGLDSDGNEDSVIIISRPSTIDASYGGVVDALGLRAKFLIEEGDITSATILYNSYKDEFRLQIDRPAGLIASPEVYEFFYDPVAAQLIAADSAREGRPMPYFLRPKLNRASEPLEEEKIRQAQYARFGEGGSFESDSDEEKFLAGFLEGFAAGGVEMVTGTAEVVSSGVSYTFACVYQVGLSVRVFGNWLVGDEEDVNRYYHKMEVNNIEIANANQAMKETAITLGKAGLATYEAVNDHVEARMGSIIGQIIGDEKIESAADAKIASDMERLNFFRAEIGDIIMSELREEGTTDIDPHAVGYVTGRITFEVATIAVSFVKIEKIQAIMKLNKLKDRLPPGVSSNLMTNISRRIAKYVNKLRTTKMCFVAGTLVTCKIGGSEQLIPIEALEGMINGGTGVEVWAKDEFTGEMGWKRILAFFLTHPDQLVHLSYDVDGDGIADETLSGTHPHPFWVVGREEFVPMGQLEPGNVLYLADGGLATVTGASRERAPPGETFTTYNFEVEDFHTYFVGESGVWVHNSGRAECEKIFAIYDYTRRNRLGNGIDETRYQSFIHMLETLKTSSNPAHNNLADAAFDFTNGKFNGRAIRFALKAMNDEMFELVAKGDLPVSALPTMSGTKGAFPGLGVRGRPNTGDFDRHHLMEKDYFKRLFAGDSEDVPAYIVEALEHRLQTGGGTIRSDLVSTIGNSTDPRLIYWGHIDVYENLGHNDLAKVFTRWWSEVMNQTVPPRP